MFTIYKTIYDIIDALNQKYDSDEVIEILFGLRSYICFIPAKLRSELETQLNEYIVENKKCDECNGNLENSHVFNSSKCTRCKKDLSF